MSMRSAFIAAVSVSVAGALAVLLITFGLAVHPTAEVASGTVQSMATLEHALAHHPAGWLHRPVRVQAALGITCTTPAGLYALCASWSPTLVDPGQPDDPQALIVVWDHPSPLRTLLQHLPLLTSLAPTPQGLHGEVPAIYRVEVSPLSLPVQSATVSYQALILDTPQPADASK